MQVVRSEISLRAEELREARLGEARSSMEGLFNWAIGPATSDPIHRFDLELHRRLMALGLAMVALWLAYRVPDAAPLGARNGRGWYRYEGIRGRVVRTRFGECWWLRPVYRRLHGEGAALVAPADREVGLAPGGMSLTVHLLAANMCARLPFEEAKEVTEVFGDYAPSTRSLQGIVDLVGPAAADHMLELPAPDDDGDVLCIEIDGMGVPHMTEQEHRRRCVPHEKRPRGLDRRARKLHRRSVRKGRARKKVGDKSKNARVATIGIVYTLRQMPDGSVEGPLNRRVFGTFSGPKELARQVLAEARKRGYGSKETLFLADGALHLWSIWRRYFPLAKPCLDWIHATEYMWGAGSALHGAKAREPWVAARLEELMRGDLDAVLGALTEGRASLADAPGKSGKKKRKKLKKAIRYLRNHREMMSRYGELDHRNLNYATGMVEGTIKHLRARLDAGGMRWGSERSEAMLALRCVLLSGEWETFEERVRRNHESGKSWKVPRVTRKGPCSPHIPAKKAA